MTRHTLLALALAMGCFAAFGATGCKNTCDKAMSHLEDCKADFCADNEGHPACAEDAEAPEAPGECNETAEAQAQAMLDMSCEQIAAMMGGGMPGGGGGGE